MKKKKLSLTQRVFGTLVILLLFRLCSHIPLPFVRSDYLKSMIEANGSLGLLNTLTGGNLANMSIVALGITPYITASIMLQLLGVVFPRLAAMQKEGSTGEKKIKKMTFGLGAVLALLQAFSMMYGYGHKGMLEEVNWFTITIPALIMTIGVMIVSFAGQYITDHFFGNGISLILVIGILSSYVSDIADVLHVVTVNRMLWAKILFVVFVIIAIVLLYGFVCWMTYAEKRLPITYSGKIQNGGRNSSISMIPLKLMGGSVVPIIFASSLLTIPALIQSFLGTDVKWLRMFNMNYWLRSDFYWTNIGLLLYFLMILGFSYYYQNLNLNESELALNLKKHGGVINGIRPGIATEQYLRAQMKYLTLLGGIGLCLIAFVPIIASRILGLPSLSFFGTSVIIVVSVILECDEKWLTEHQFSAYDIKQNKHGGKNYGK